jgi:predicted RNase H-like HicB family nuclease
MMAMQSYYPAIIEKEDDSDFGVFFPDLPGCVTAGRTAEEALHRAEEAVQFHIDGIVEDHEPLPAPTPVERVVVEKGVNAVAVTLVPVRLPGKSVRVNITVDENLLASIDRAAKSLGYSRSGFLAEAARDKLTEET